MINKLTDIYVKWCSDNNVPNVSADEQDRDKWDKHHEYIRQMRLDLKNGRFK